MKKRFDAVVIGGGVLGTFHAYHLAQKGLSVAVFEKDAQPRQATVRNFGQVVPSGFPIGKWNSYGQYSTDLYKEVQKKHDIGISENGSLYIASDLSEMAVLEEMHRKFSDVDYFSELYTRDQVLSHSDLFLPEYAVGGLFFPQEVSADSRRMIHSMHNYLEEEFEVDFFYQQMVIDIDVNSSSANVQLANGTRINCDRVFLCNGHEFNVLFPELFNGANIEVSKLQMMQTEPLSSKLPGNILTGLTIRRYESFKSCESYAKLNPVNAKPELTDEGIHILFKQNPDGSVILGDSHSYADASMGFDAGFDEDGRVNDLMIAEAKKIINVPNLKIQKYWSGFYGQMKGDEEIYEKVVNDRIHIVTAIGGKGMTASAGYSNEHINQIY